MAPRATCIKMPAAAIPQRREFGKSCSFDTASSQASAFLAALVRLGAYLQLIGKMLEEGVDEAHATTQIAAGEAGKKPEKRGGLVGGGSSVAKGLADGLAGALQDLRIDRTEHFGEENAIAHGPNRLRRVSRLRG